MQMLVSGIGDFGTKEEGGAIHERLRPTVTNHPMNPFREFVREQAYRSSGSR
jgi:hypothetical protein